MASLFLNPTNNPGLQATGPTEYTRLACMIQGVSRVPHHVSCALTLAMLPRGAWARRNLALRHSLASMVRTVRTKTHHIYLRNSHIVSSRTMGNGRKQEIGEKRLGEKAELIGWIDCMPTTCLMADDMESKGYR